MDTKSIDKQVDRNALVRSFRMQDMTIFWTLLIGMPVSIVILVGTVILTASLGVGFLALAACIAASIWVCVKQPKRMVYIFQDHFCIESSKEKRCYPWSGIVILRTVAQDRTPGDDKITILRFELLTSSGEQVKIRRVGAETSLLRDLLCDYTAIHIRAQYETKLFAQKALVFGNVRLEPDGLREGRKFFPREQLSELDLSYAKMDGIVVRRTDGKIATIIYRLGFPNDHVFPSVFDLWLRGPKSDHNQSPGESNISHPTP